MSYCTTNEVINQLGVSTLGNLMGGPVRRSQVKEIRQSCAGEINSYLSVQSRVPVDPFDDPPLESKLRDVELALVENQLYMGLSTTEAPQRIKDRLDDAAKWLEKVRDRKVILRAPHGARSLSVEQFRGDTRQQIVYRTLEFNWESIAGDDEANMELADTGQPYWFTDAAGYIDSYTVRASGDQAEAAAIQPAINGVNTDVEAMISLIWGTNPRRARVQNSSVPFAVGDRVSVSVIPGGALQEGIDLKVFLRLSIRALLWDGEYGGYGGYVAGY